MTQARPIVETYQTKPEDFEPSEEQAYALDRVQMARLLERNTDKDTREAAEKAKASLTGDDKTLAEQAKRLKKRAAYSALGWCWHARILDARTNEVLFDSPLAYTSREYADRHGQRLIKRFKQTGSWTEKTGVSAVPAQ